MCIYLIMQRYTKKKHPIRKKRAKSNKKYNKSKKIRIFANSIIKDRFPDVVDYHADMA